MVWGMVARECCDVGSVVCGVVSASGAITSRWVYIGAGLRMLQPPVFHVLCGYTSNSGPISTPDHPDRPELGTRCCCMEWE